MTKPITITIPHELGRAEAHRRIEEGFGKLEHQLSGGMGQLRKSWQGDRLSFSAQVLGQGVTGRLDVLDNAIGLEIDLPGFLAAIADRLKGRLQKEGQLLLEKR